MKRLAACSALFGALFLLTGCTVSIAQQPPSDETIPPTEPSPAPASTSLQNTTTPTDAMTVEKPASLCKGLAQEPCRNKKAEAERPSLAARNVEARRKAEAKRKTAEQRKAKAAALQRLTEERKAREGRIAAAARVAKEAEEKRLIQERQAEEARKADAAHAQLEASQSGAPPYIADKFKRAFERGRSTWLNAQ